MSLKSLRKLFAVGLLVVTGYGWATPSVGTNTNATWQDISSIQWSTDNGVTWGNSSLVLGQSVEFKITMHKTNIGNHRLDLVKAWIDLNGDGDFVDANEVSLSNYRVANSAPRSSGSTERLDGGYYDFLSSSIAVTNAMVGDHWLLARVTCSDSLLSTARDTGLTGSYSWYDQWSSYSPAQMQTWFSPTAYYWQGDTHLVKLTVGDNAVPEPGTLALFAAAMVGVIWTRKRVTGI